MGKRFPIPSFEYERFKDLPWGQPTLLPVDQQDELHRRRASNEGVGWTPRHVQISAAFCERYRLRGPWVHAVMCPLPLSNVLVVGRSHAWSIQQALVVDSLDAESSRVLLQWKTPRPMNTRLGPEDGVTLEGVPTVYVICGHRYADYWLVNRTAVEDKTLDGRNGFSVISASDDEINDFHACNLSFSWA